MKAGLIDWLTGSLPGVYIPRAFSLGEIVKFVFSVLGLTWQNVRQKLVKVVGEPAVAAMEVGFDIVKTLVTQGPAAAWDKIKDALSNLQDMVIGGITDFVVDMVVKKAVPKIIAMFIPGAGFISAILSIYDTVMVFVNKISKIIQVVTGFINSITAIAAGNIAAAASKVESTLAGLLSLAINFLAGFAGLGKVADKVMGIINKVRAPVDKALDSLINWIVTMAKKLFAKVFGKKDAKDDRTDAQKQKDLKSGIAEATAVVNDKKIPLNQLNSKINAIKTKYKMTKLVMVSEGKSDSEEFAHIEGEINPKDKGPKATVLSKKDLKEKQAEEQLKFPVTTNPARLLGPGNPSTKTRQQVANMGGTGTDRGSAAEQHEQEVSGGRREVPSTTALGGRRHDNISEEQGGVVEVAKEIKNYKRWVTIEGNRIEKVVPMSSELMAQINKDTLWRRDGKKLKPPVNREVRWIFYGAPPSAQLMAYLVARGFLVVSHG